MGIRTVNARELHQFLECKRDFEKTELLGKDFVVYGTVEEPLFLM